VTDNPRNWQPPYEDDDEFWKRFEDSLNAAQGKNPNAPEPVQRDPSELEDRFIPPEPPPITPPPDAIARAAWIAVIVGPLLALVGYIFAVSTFLGGIGIGATIVGFIILIARRDRHIPPGEDHGDGAVV
jgi:hypothetical protein